MALHTYLSIITLNANGFNVPTKRHWVVEWIRKQDLYICCLQETQIERYPQTKRGGKRYSMQMKKKKISVAILISEKLEFKTMAILKDKEGHYTMKKGTIQQEDTALGHIYAPNMGALKYVKQVL